MTMEVLDIVEADLVEEAVTHTNIRILIDYQYRKIPKNISTFLIWRVEDAKLEPLSKDQYGTFYDKECYVIYAATQYGKPSGPNALNREIRGKIEYHLHFWLGSSINSENGAVAAYTVVEMDGLLGGNTTQHREIQGKESARFKSYFKEGMSVLTGSSENLYFKSLDDRTIPRLFRVKGFQVPVLTQMPTISWNHFNSGDVFLLYTKNKIFIWVGRFALPIEKLHATEAALQLGKSYGISHIFFVDDGYEKTLELDCRNNFEIYLPLSVRSVKAVDELGDDAGSGSRLRVGVKLYHCCDHNGKYRVTELKTGPLNQEDLISTNVMIIDNNLNGIWIWVGKNADNKEKVEAIRNARGYVKKKKYPNDTPVTRVVEGTEPMEFKELFNSWVEKDDQKTLYGKNRVPVIKVTRYDVVTMHDRPHLSAKSQLFDDGSGQMRIWRIQKFDSSEIPKECFGIFFTADCYVILYTYKTPSGTRWIIYFWEGFHSVTEEKGVAELKAAEINRTLANDRAAIARICQGKEPAHFLQLLKGRMRVFSGRGLDYDVSGTNQKTPTHYLLQIQGSASYNTRATQVQLKASSLNSNYCFVLRKNSYYYIWCGSHSTGDNREMAKGFVGADFVLLLEGSETPDFWSSVCGKHEYKSPKYVEITERPVRPRLFHCVIKYGYLTAEEVLNFVQKDLYPEQIMLLDAYHTIFLWVGDECTNEDQRMCFETVNEYLRTDPCARDMTTPVVLLKQGFEPPIFTGFFDSWDDELWKCHTTYEALRTKIEFESGTSSAESLVRRPSEQVESDFHRCNKYSISVLRGPIENMPPSVDPLKKELHLTYDDFMSLFDMDYKDFGKIPLWKQQEMKKHAGLF